MMSTMLDEVTQEQKRSEIYGLAIILPKSNRDVRENLQIHQGHQYWHHQRFTSIITKYSSNYLNCCLMDRRVPHPLYGKAMGELNGQQTSKSKNICTTSIHFIAHPTSVLLDSPLPMEIQNFGLGMHLERTMGTLCGGCGWKTRLNYIWLKGGNKTGSCIRMRWWASALLSTSNIMDLLGRLLWLFSRMPPDCSHQYDDARPRRHGDIAFKNHKSLLKWWNRWCSFVVAYKRTTVSQSNL